MELLYLICMSTLKLCNRSDNFIFFSLQAATPLEAILNALALEYLFQIDEELGSSAWLVFICLTFIATLAYDNP